MEDCKILGGVEKVNKEQVTTLSHNARIGGASNDTDQVAGWKHRERTRKKIVLGNLSLCGNTNAL